ncbi:MAG: alpha/beta hydrolase [Cyanobacteria bacterium P01_A01_bin.17]
MKTSHPQETIQTIYFATNRNPNNKSNPTSFGDMFSSADLGDLRFGEAQVRNETLDKSTIRTLPDNSEEGSKVLFDNLRNAMRNQSQDSLIFIHGFNVTFTQAIESAAKMGNVYARLSKDKDNDKYDPNIFVFSWPSNGKIFEYQNDRHDAEASGYAFARGLGKLTEFLRATVKGQACQQKIHLMAHSMGVYVLRHAVQQTQKISIGKLPRLFDDIILAAADEDNDAFEHDYKLAKLAELGQRVTVYCNSGDQALRVSDITKGNPDRLGHDGPLNPHLVSSKVVTVDVSDVVNGIVVNDIAEHAYHVEVEKVAKDILAVLRGKSSETIASRRYVPHANKFRLE